TRACTGQIGQDERSLHPEGNRQDPGRDARPLAQQQRAGAFPRRKTFEPGRGVHGLPGMTVMVVRPRIRAASRKRQERAARGAPEQTYGPGARALKRLFLQAQLPCIVTVFCCPFATHINKHVMPDPHPVNPDAGVVVEEAKPEVKQPPLYRVVLLNDDYTPMEFVVDVLEKFFALNRPTATRIMLEVHTRGKGVCGVFTYEIAV